MQAPIYIRRAAALGLALCGLWLTACTTPPGGPGMEATEPPPATEESAAPAAETNGLSPEQTALRSDLATVGVEVSETAEGRIKLIIPSDMSFGLGSATIKRSSAKMLNDLAVVLNKHPNSAIEIIGHTDASGTDAVNLPLSAKRAESTRDYLIGQKVAADRFTTQGWGADQPVAENNTAAGRAANRRVEVFITEQ
jgi:outer membrane protein OmpA-like peptidoglycan-associated protein